MPRTITSTASGSAFEKFLLPALLEKAQAPARQTEAAGEGQAGGAEQVRRPT